MQIVDRASRINMLLNTTNYRSPPRVDLCDFNDLIFRTKSIGKRSSSNSTTKTLSYDPLRFTMNPHLTSRIVIFPKTTVSSRNSNDVQRTRQRKKRTAGLDVYRTLVRPETLSLNSFERDSFTDSFIIDRISPPAIKNVTRPKILPKVLPKPSTTTNRTARNLSSVVHMPPSSPMNRHLTTPVDESSDTDLNVVSSIVSSTVSDSLPRKRLHIYLP